MFTPLQAGPLLLPNRVVMGSMHTGLEEQRGRLDRLAAFLAARARGGVGLIVTGGVAPDRAGRLGPFSARMASARDARRHRPVTDAVHAEGGRIAMQILHAGRYARQPFPVAPSAVRSPISPFRPRALSSRGIRATIDAFARSAELAAEAGYDGVEVMGSEGYLLCEFAAQRTNKRADEWGGEPEGRFRFPLEVVRAVRGALGPGVLLIFRLSMLDLVDGGSTWPEVVLLARTVVEAGADVIDTGIGWHEARVPTIAAAVPRGAFSWVTGRLASEVGVPLIASNRVNTPELAEEILARGDADLVSLARPLLADPDFVQKARDGREDEIATCVACNQGCLDRIFSGERATCLVNPLACRETELVPVPARRPRRIAVVGAGPAGLAFAATSAGRGHEVVLFEEEVQVGGQLRMARRIPGKQEWGETLRWFRRRIEKAGVDTRLGRRATASDLLDGGFDRVVLATGVVPRRLELPGIDHPSVLSYAEVLGGGAEVGRRVAILGAGGIGFDVALFLAHVPSAEDPLASWMAEWGVDRRMRNKGGLCRPIPPSFAREVTLCQRSTGKPGARLGRTTGWIQKAALLHRGVRMLSSCSYQRVDDLGLHLLVAGEPLLLPVDNVVVCAGQDPARDLLAPLLAAKVRVDLVGGAESAEDLDALRAIEQATRLALWV